ncbi:HAAS signaling domain-containing protein [Occultella gossypii]|uniref:DUF1700 domain-containing protein n=1 Tax=Occultella gossypii TaxID=2800820 RepID=A0ABS7S8T2_9MICO|nr:hypothetical protein [Occultella gossypii]MBZ2196757.1 hypothetical protein [Occultella gossypii]
MNRTQHPIVSAYLDDLTRALADLAPADRAEVLAGVREHIDAGLAERENATDADVAAVLAELGPPEAVARAAYDEQSDGGGVVPVRPVRWADRAWVPVLVAVLQALGVVLLLVGVAGNAAYVTIETDGGSGGTQTLYTSTFGAVFAAGLLVLPLWIVVALFVGNSRLWRTREKVGQMVLLPAVGLVLWLLPDLGWAVAGPPGLTVASIVAMIVIVAGGGWLLVVLTSAARGRVS